MSRVGILTLPEESEDTATASVGDNTAASTKPTDSGTPGMAQCTR